MINKKEFVDMVSLNTGRTKKDIDEWTSIIFDGLKEAVKLYNGIKIVNFGTFKVKNRKGRMGKNPNTNEDLYIPGTKYLHFSPSKELKGMLNY